MDRSSHGHDHVPAPAPAGASARPELRRIVALFRDYRWRLGGVLALIVLSSVVSLASPFLLRAVLDTALPQRNTTLLTWLVLGMIAVAVVTSALNVVQTWISTDVGQKVMHDLRTAVFRHLQRLSLAFFTRTRTGEVQSRIANDIGGMQSVVTTTATSVVSNVTTVVASIVAMFALDWRLALFSMAILPPAVWLSRRVGQERRRITTERQKRLADLSTMVEESLSVSGVLLGKTMGRGPDLAQRFDGSSENVADLEVRSAMAGRWRMSTIQMVFTITPALVYWFAGLTSAGGHDVVSIGTVVAFTTLQTRLLMPILSLFRTGVDMQSSLALFTRIFEYLDLEVDIDEHPGSVELDPATARGEVRFEQASFAYDPERPTLEGIDLTVAPGQTLAVVGETGSGKTTLGYLVARLYDVTGGRVTIDGVDVRDLRLESLASLVGIVSQDTYLFHASIRDNLRFARPGASDAEIEDAARAAQIHDLIAALPDGYDTMVGERGYRFSGGEQQRLAIARTVLRNPPILVLDEATSALDTQTERAVQEALDRLAVGRTTIAIAHRLSTIRDADQIAVLDNGRVVEQGTHDELVGRSGRYAALASRDPAGVPGSPAPALATGGEPVAA